jgi:hypothetical protein
MPMASIELRAAYLALHDAAAKGDAAAVMRLSVLAPQFVVVNTQRGAIQLKSCRFEDVIVASLGISNAKALADLAALLSGGKHPTVAASD